MTTFAPTAATVIAAFFAAQTALAARRARSEALAVWSFALVQFTIASGAFAWGVAFGWTPVAFRLFYLFGAILNVAWLGLGSVWFLAPRRVAILATAVLIVASVYAGYVTASGEILSMAALAQRLPRPSDVFSHDVRNLSRWFSISGSIVLIGGLIFSVTRRRRHALGLGLLAGGVVVVGVAGELARTGLVTGFAILLAVGIAVMFVGFVRSGDTRP